MRKEYTRKDLERLGLAVVREGDDKVNFDKGIGHKGNRTWSRESFGLSPMQIAILDTLYDAGEGATFTPKQMINDKTRLAWYAGRKLGSFTLDCRTNESCGHDEFEGYVYSFNEITVEQGEYGYQCNQKLVKKVRISDDEHNTDKYTELQGEKEMWKATQLALVREAGITYEQLPSYRLEWKAIENDRYKGECAWLGNDRRCSHHDGPKREFVLGHYAGESKETFVYFDEQDLETILASVNDDFVLDEIKATIPKMKTEAREWLQSTYESSEYVTDSEGNKKWVTTHHGKRGHYSLTWWHGINRRIKEQGESLYNESMDGTEKNGWVFKATKSYNAGTKGEWVPITPVEHYEIVMVESEWNSKHTGLVYRTKDEALTVVEVLNQSNRVSRKMMDGKSTAEFIVRAEELDIHMSPHFNPDTCTPVDYASMEYDCKLTKELKEQGCNLVHEVTA